MFYRLTVRFSALALVFAICTQGRTLACPSPHSPRPVMIKLANTHKPTGATRHGNVGRPNNTSGSSSTANATDGFNPEMQWTNGDVARGTADISGTTGTGEDHHQGGGTDRDSRWDAFEKMRAENAAISANANKWADRYGKIETGATIVKWTCVAANIIIAPFAAAGMAIGGSTVVAGDAAVKVYAVGIGTGAATGFADGTASKLAEGKSVGEAVSHGGKKAVVSAIVNGVGGAIPGGGKVTSMIVNAGTAGADELIGGAVGSGGGSSYSSSSVPNEIYSPMGYDTTSSGQKMYH